MEILSSIQNLFNAIASSLSNTFTYCHAWILTHNYKGKKGEIKVSSILSMLPSKHYTLINNVLLPVNENGDTIQIDHIVVSSYGVFVIETKNYSGTVYGLEKQEYWNQYLGHKCFEFRNPIIQNSAHTNALRKIFAQHGNIHLIPIVAFVGNAKIKAKSHSAVVSGLASLIYEILRHRTFYLMPQQRYKIIECLDLCNLSSTLNDNEHRKQAIIKNDRAIQRIENGCCPRCGGSLLPRKGKYGNFYGCENYPQCRYTINI